MHDDGCHTSVLLDDTSNLHKITLLVDWYLHGINISPAHANHLALGCSTNALTAFWGPNSQGLKVPQEEHANKNWSMSLPSMSTSEVAELSALSEHAVVQGTNVELVLRKSGQQRSTKPEIGYGIWLHELWKLFFGLVVLSSGLNDLSVLPRLNRINGSNSQNMVQTTAAFAPTEFGVDSLLHRSKQSGSIPLRAPTRRTPGPTAPSRLQREFDSMFGASTSVYGIALDNLRMFERHRRPETEHS
ncbi:hypothetical protein F5141DRAFT_1204100 [Pisolithus sp. B1]|nr:hypothetical protein F5141DRAFT_1204100 [Pisolithus sp. B1]